MRLLIPAALVILLVAFARLQVQDSNQEGHGGHAVAHAERVSFDELEADNPVRPVPGKLVGHDMAVDSLPDAPDAGRARLGRWLYYDTRISADGSISCATCHVPEHGFSELTPVSTGIRGQKGTRKAPSFVNAVFAFYPETFWDGRAASLEEQAVGPMANPIEMGNEHDVVVKTVAGIEQYRHYFEQAFGDSEVTLDRIAHAIADYERTRVSANSRYDRWVDADEDDAAGQALLSPLEIEGHDLFFGDALCATCHVGSSFTDSKYHNLGIGWDAATGKLADEGRFVVTGVESDHGAFKTPGLRETTRHPPYMHDGSLATLKDVMVHYNKGGTPNPWLSPKLKPLGLSDHQLDALVAFMGALEGEGFMDTAPKHFPQ
ncbi:MAG: cytochrome-c peroxidase [Planctomycetes bacterium]|nr:cytochrome-c peroxidase [Planctomycetota bacterium]